MGQKEIIEIQKPLWDLHIDIKIYYDVFSGIYTMDYHWMWKWWRTILMNSQYEFFNNMILKSDFRQLQEQQSI